MGRDRVTVTFIMTERKENREIEIPLFLTANELILALAQAYGLEMDVSDLCKCCLTAENPIALLKGSKTLEEFGLRNGTVIYFTGKEGGKGERPV